MVDVVYQPWTQGVAPPLLGPLRQSTTVCSLMEVRMRAGEGVRSNRLVFSSGTWMRHGPLGCRIHVTSPKNRKDFSRQVQVMDMLWFSMPQRWLHVTGALLHYHLLPS